MRYSFPAVFGVLLTSWALAQESLPEKLTYKLGPDSLPQEGVPTGKLIGPVTFKSKVFAGTVRQYWVYVPTQYKPEKAACVFVCQDGQRAVNPKGSIRVPVVLDNLIHRKAIPVTIGIFPTPGHKADEYPATLGMSNPNNRSVEYDSLGDAYAKHIVDELLPEVGKSYTLSKKPEDRAIGGRRSRWRGNGPTNLPASSVRLAASRISVAGTSIPT
jgi:Putative esterase